MGRAGLILFVLALTLTARGQTSGAFAQLELVSRPPDSDLFFILSLDHQPGQPEEIRAAMQQVCAKITWQDEPPLGWDKWSEWSVNATCASVFERAGLVVEGETDLTPLAQALRRQGWESLAVSVWHPAFGFTEMKPKAVSAQPGFLTATYWFLVPDQLDPPKFRLSYGYRNSDLVLIVVSLAAALLLPVGATWWLRRRALLAPDGASLRVWFHYKRFQPWITAGTWIAWILAVLFSGALMLLVLWVGATRTFEIMFLLLMALLFAPPLLVWLVRAGLSHAVMSRYSTTSRTLGGSLGNTLWSRVALVGPGVVLCLGAWVYGPRSIGLAAVCVVVAVVTVVAVFRHGRLGSRRPMPPGELRERAFSLAERVGVRLKEIHLVERRRSGGANAFAARGNQVWITARVLENLSKREVDAVLVHELEHLKRRHPTWLSLASTLAAIACLGVLLSAVLGLRLPSSVSWLVWLGLPAWLVPLLSRRFERRADAGSIALTADPEAFLSGQVKLARLNLGPLDWDHSEWSSTHSATDRRLQDAARRWGVSEERLEQLLQTPVEAGDRYLVPRLDAASGRSGRANG